MITLPFDCDVWAKPVSSNVLGYGVKGEDLIVLFKGGGAYKYPLLGDRFQMMYDAPSVGKVVAAHVRNEEFVRIHKSEM